MVFMTGILALVDRAHDAENDIERERLRALVRRSSDAELGRHMPGGWTVAAVLAHVGFWDARAIAFYDTWSHGDAPVAAYYETEETDWENDSVKPLCLALSGRHRAGPHYSGPVTTLVTISTRGLTPRDSTT